MKRLVESRLPTQWGAFQVFAYGMDGDLWPHLALVQDALQPGEHVVDVRVHSECMTGDVFGSVRCECGEQLHAALQQFGKHGGICVYLRQEGRGIGLVEKLRAYGLQDQGLDTFAANRALGHADDERDYSDAVTILQDLGVKRLRLWTNNPDKARALQAAGLEVVACVPLEVPAREENRAYLQAKQIQKGHFLNILSDIPPAI